MELFELDGNSPQRGKNEPILGENKKSLPQLFKPCTLESTNSPLEANASKGIANSDYCASLIATCIGWKKGKIHLKYSKMAFAANSAEPFPPAASILSVISPPAAYI